MSGSTQDGAQATSVSNAGTQTSQKSESDANDKVSSVSIADNKTSENETKTTGSKTLVVYFSRTGEQYTVGVKEEVNTWLSGLGY